MVSLQNLLSLEELSERIRAENTESARLNQEKMSIDNEVPFVRQGSGRRPGPRKTKKRLLDYHKIFSADVSFCI